MNNLANSKIESLTPKWSQFFGMSLLFDNPGNSLRLVEKTGNHEILQIDCSLEIPFYRSIKQCLDELSPSLPGNDYLFCRLPYNSYHITVNDLAHKENLLDFNPASRRGFSGIFSKYPHSLQQALELSPFLQHNEMITKKDWGINFQVNYLTIWGGKVLVVCLKPAGEESKEKFQKLEKFRNEVNTLFQEAHGYSRDIRDTYSIHLSLGYMGNQNYGRKFKAILEKWNDHFQKRMIDETGKPLAIEFNSISLYGFTDMVTFFKAV